MRLMATIVPCNGSRCTADLIAVMDDPRRLLYRSIVERLLQRVESVIAAQRTRCPHTKIIEPDDWPIQGMAPALSRSSDISPWSVPNGIRSQDPQELSSQAVGQTHKDNDLREEPDDESGRELT